MDFFDPRRCLQLFFDLLENDVWRYCTRSIQLKLPVFSPEVLKQILNNTSDIFKEEENLLNLQSPITVVGDLHGNLLDLLTILRRCGVPPSTRYLFLGDLIDRGEFSLETITFVYLLKICYPKDVFIIRGNHELLGVCLKFGYKEEIRKKYTDNSVFSTFTSTFSYTPFAALIDSHILCIHGGIGPCINSLKDLNDLKRPLRRLRHRGPAVDVLWSDPGMISTEYEDSPRGYGHIFGKNHCIQFQQRNGISLIIRGHEVATNGINYGFEGRILTVFSASNYCNMGNDGGVVEVMNGGHLQEHTYRPYKTIITANDAFFYNALEPNGKKTPFLFPVLKHNRSPSVPKPKTKKKRKLRRSKSENMDRLTQFSDCISQSASDDSLSQNIALLFPDSAVDMSKKKKPKRPNPIPLPPTSMHLGVEIPRSMSRSVCCEESELDIMSEMPSPSVIDGLNKSNMKMHEEPWRTARRSKSVGKIKKAKAKTKAPKRRRKSPEPKPPQDNTSEMILLKAKKPSKKKRRKVKAKHSVEKAPVEI